MSDVSLHDGVLSDEEVFNKLAQIIVSRGMTIPAVMFLETMKPLNFIGAQILVFFGPFLESFFPGEQYYRFTELMEDRKSVEILLQKIEEMEDKKKADDIARRESSPRRRPKWKFLSWRK